MHAGLRAPERKPANSSCVADLLLEQRLGHLLLCLADGAGVLGQSRPSMQLQKNIKFNKGDDHCLSTPFG